MKGKVGATLAVLLLVASVAGITMADSSNSTGSRVPITVWTDNHPERINATAVATGGSIEEYEGRVSLWFEYRPLGTSTWERTPRQVTTSPTTLEKTIHGLEPNLEYEIRMMVDAPGVNADHGQLSGGIVRVQPVEAGQETETSQGNSNGWLRGAGQLLALLVGVPLVGGLVLGGLALGVGRYRQDGDGD